MELYALVLSHSDLVKRSGKMGKPTGFMEFEREVSRAEEPGERIRHFGEFHEHLSREEPCFGISHLAHGWVSCSLMPSH